MDDRPLFGAGSKPSLHAKKQVAFLRPAETTDGRLHPCQPAASCTPAPPSAINGTKAMRQHHSPTPQPIQQPPIQGQPVQGQQVPGQPVQYQTAVPVPPPVAGQPPAAGQMAAPVAPQNPPVSGQIPVQPAMPQPVQPGPITPAGLPNSPSPAPQMQPGMQATQPVMQTMSPQMQAAQLAAQQPTATVGQPLPQAAPPQLQPGQQAVPQPVAAVVQQAPGQQIPLQPAPGIQVPIQGQQISMQQAGVVAPTAPLAQAAEPYYPAQPATGSEDDRREARKRTLKGGMIVLRGQMMSSYACKIRNESSGGVMLVLADAHLVPPEFYLVRDADPGNKIPCRVAWREKGRLGAQFIPALSPL